MNTEFLNNYSQQLESKKNELIRKLQNQVVKIEIPTANSTNVPTATGAALFLIGLCSKSTFWTILGGIALGAGAYRWYKDKNSQSTPVQPKPNYTVLAAKVNDAIRNIHTSISSDWDSFVSKQVSDIKSQYVTSQLSEKQRNEINDLLMTHSLISFSIMDVFPRLMSIARGGNVSEFNSFVDSFKNEYMATIESAFSEQLKTLNQVALVLN